MDPNGLIYMGDDIPDEDAARLDGFLRGRAESDKGTKEARGSTRGIQGEQTAVIPSGKPIPGVTNLGDVEWALTRARRYLFRGGDPTDPRYREFVNRWLDYRAEIAGTKLEHVGVARELRPSRGDKPT